jgi:RND family efflux transporter MFP subunit
MKSIYIPAILALTISFSACSSKEDASDSQGQAEELPQVQVSFATRQEVHQIKTYTANVEADNLNNISPSTPNRIKTITVDVGDRVRRGQVLVSLDRATIDQLKVRLENAEREYNRAVQLLEIGAGTQQSVDQYKTELDAARTQYNNTMENTVLTSPINGVVTARNYDPGDMSSSLPILTVGQLSPAVKVIINITENDLTKIQKGMNVTVSFDALPESTFPAKISRIYPTIDTATRTFQAEILINNPNEKILPGMFARVEINLGSQDNVVVPDRAIVKQTGSGNRYVYVYKNGKVSYNKVELGQRINDTYELLSGVESGDTVVITGQSRLADGVAVQVIK